MYIKFGFDNSAETAFSDSSNANFNLIENDI